MKWVVLFSVVFSSCNISLLVPKTKVINEASGYLLYRGRECLFFRDDEPFDFFKKVNRNDGYRIYQGCGIEAMEYLAHSYSVETIYGNKGAETIIADTIRIVAVQIRYLPIKFRIAEKVPVVLKYNSRVYEYGVWDIFNGEVLSINQRVADD